MSSAANFWIGVLMLAIGTYGGYTFWKIAKRNSHDSAAVEVRLGEAVPDEVGADDTGEPEDFVLTTQTGELFQSKNLKGKVWVGSLFYSVCPKVCKMQNQQIATLRKQLADANLTWVSITCDPEMDTPAVLKEYAARFDADPRDWKFLTGDVDVIRSVAVNRFKVKFGRQEHSEHVILIGRDGKTVGWYSVFDGRDVGRFVEKVRELTAPPVEVSEVPQSTSTPAETDATKAPAEPETTAEAEKPVEAKPPADETPRAGN